MGICFKLNSSKTLKICVITTRGTYRVTNPTTLTVKCLHRTTQRWTSVVEPRIQNWWCNCSKRLGSESKLGAGSWSKLEPTSGSGSKCIWIHNTAKNLFVSSPPWGCSAGCRRWSPRSWDRPARAALRWGRCRRCGYWAAAVHHTGSRI